MKVDIKNAAGGSAGSADLDEAIFGITPNVAVMHQVVTAQLAGRRRGTHSTKTRAEVRGGGAKPWKQKGTGRARAGSSRSPIWTGGGVAHGPRPRNYEQATPKKMKKLALRSALSDRASLNQIIVVDKWEFDTPNTKRARASLLSVGATGHVLVVLEADDITTAKSFRNLEDVTVVSSAELTTYDVLVSDFVVFTKANIPASSAAPKKAETA